MSEQQQEKKNKRIALLSTTRDTGAGGALVVLDRGLACTKSSTSRNMVLNLTLEWIQREVVIFNPKPR